MGFDSLDYYLVVKYNLRYLMQKEYGKVEINVGVLSTPTIWTSFITGLPPKDHGVIGWKWKNPVLDKLKRKAVKTGLNKIPFDRSMFLTQLVRKRIKGDVPNIKGRIPTIFDYSRSPVDINVPCYSEDAYEEQRHEIAYGLGNPIVEKQIGQKYWKTFRKKRETVLNALNKTWDLFMVHFFLPDVIQHILWYREDEIRKLHMEMDETAHLIEKCVGENALVIFVSDHGQKRGLHTPYGFYSCNQKLNLHEPKITDFADIIKRELGAPTKNEIEQVKKKLEKLGYF